MAQNQLELTKLKPKLQTLLTKLSDRDTHKAAITELNKISTTLNAKTLPIFISTILSVSSSDKPLLKKHSLCLLSTLSLHHTNSLCPYLPKILSFLLLRLRDTTRSDASSIRTQCVSTVKSLSSNVTKLVFFTAFLKPLTEALTTERVPGAQLGIGLCLAAAVEASPPQREVGWRWVLGKVERLLRSEGFLAKGAGLMVIGSVVGVGGLKGYNGVGSLLKLLIGFLSAGDWQVRKATAEALVKLAVVEGDGGGVGAFKNECLVVFEKKRFDKVKAVRDAMSKLIEAWRLVPDVCNEESPPLQSLGSSLSENEIRKHHTSPSTDASGVSGSTLVKNGVEGSMEKRFKKPETKRGLFSQNSDNKVLHSASPVSGCHEKRSSSTVEVNNTTEDYNSNHNDCNKHLSIIRDQIARIEGRQASLIDLSQRFMGSSQDGMRSLESRINSLELALGEISRDLAGSSRRMTTNSKASCCLLRRAELLSSKFWKLTRGCCYSIAKPPSSAAARPMATTIIDNNNDDDGEFIVNPLAEIRSDNRAVFGS